MADTYRLAIGYSDLTGGNKGTASAKTVDVSDTSITYGPSTDFVTSINRGAMWIEISMLTTTKFIVIWGDAISLNWVGRSKVGTISGTDITFGAESILENGSFGLETCELAALNATTAVAIYRDERGSGSNAPFVAKIATISGTTITWGIEFTHSTVGTRFVWGDLIIMDATRLIACWFEQQNTNGYAVVMTVTGANITFGVDKVIDASAQGFSADKLSDTKFIVIWSTPEGVSAVGTMTGTTITFGSIVQFSSSTLGDNSGEQSDMVVLSATKFIACWKNTGNANHGISRVGTVTGDSISFGTATEFHSVAVSSVTVSKLNSTQFIVVYSDQSALKGSSKIGTISGTDVTYGAISQYLTTASSGISGIGLDLMETISSSATLLLAPPNLQGNIGTHIGKGMQ